MTDTDTGPGPAIHEHLRHAASAMAAHIELPFAKAQVLASEAGDTSTAERVAKLHAAVKRIIELTAAEAERHTTRRGEWP